MTTLFDVGASPNAKIKWHKCDYDDDDDDEEKDKWSTLHFSIIFFHFHFLTQYGKYASWHLV